LRAQASGVFHFGTSSSTDIGSVWYAPSQGGSGSYPMLCFRFSWTDDVAHQYSPLLLRRQGSPLMWPMQNMAPAKHCNFSSNGVQVLCKTEYYYWRRCCDVERN
jgi:hypothetical protein